MARRFVAAILLTLILVIDGLGVSLAAQGDRRPRYVPPADGKPGRINLEEYFKLTDSREAARLLVEEATRAGLDVDKWWDPELPEHIWLGSGNFTPDLADSAFVQRARSLSEAGAEGEEFICLIKLHRGLSIREKANMMAMGVHLYRGVEYNAYIARVNAGTIPVLRELDPVVWIGELTPELKYRRDEKYTQEGPFWVFSLIGPTPECRADLERLGAKILNTNHMSVSDTRWEAYSIRIDPSRVGELARLWWVHHIHQERWRNLEAGAEVAAGAVPLALPMLGELKPHDSRRLVSLADNSPFSGAGQTVLIFELQLDWDHPDIFANFNQDIRYPKVDDVFGTHGAMVAGVAVGRKNAGVRNGGISGVAPQARFRFVNGTIFNILEEDIALAWIQNFSQGDAVPENNGHYTPESRFFDELARSGAVPIVAAGNEGGDGAFNNQNLESSVSPGACAKNVISVGAVHHVPAEAEGDTVGQVARYSSVGPSLDGILKPDLVAPGGGTPCALGVVSCGATVAEECESFDAAHEYFVAHGTSLAAPHVTGAAAVITESFKHWVLANNLYLDSNYNLTTRLARALLVNTAIPLRFGVDFGRDAGRYIGTEAQDRRLLCGYANTYYGHGLVNCFSGVNSPDTEYRRVLVWQDDFYDYPSEKERDFELNLRDDNGNVISPRFLVATMCFDDYPGAGVVNKLRFSLTNVVTGATHVYTLPERELLGIDRDLVPGSVQKIIVPWPSTGAWKARVSFNESSGQSQAERTTEFAVVVDALIQAPALAVVGLKPEAEPYVLRLGTGMKLELPVTIENVGGNVAAGVTVRIESPLWTDPDGDRTREFYVGNLNKRGAKATKTFTLLPQPGVAGQEYSVWVVVDAANRLIDGGPYPIRRRVRVKIENFRFVRGEVVTFPGLTKGLQNVEILVNGVPSGERTGTDGKYEIEVSKGFAGEIRPRKGTTRFDPPFTDYSENPVLDDAPNDDYEAEYRRISGRVFDEGGHGVSGLVILPYRAPGSDLHAYEPDTTEANGSFDIYTEHGWSGHLEPQSTRYVFQPMDPQRAWLDSVTVDVQDQNYLARDVFLWTQDGELVSSTAVDGTQPQVVPDGLGGAIVVWTDQRNLVNGNDIWCRRLGGAGAGWEAPVCQAPGGQDSPTAARLTDGTVLVVWVDRRNGSSDVYAQRIDPAAGPMWVLDGVPVCTAAGDQRNVDVVATPGASAVLAWEDKRTGVSGIRTQQLLADGNVTWTADGVEVGVDEGFEPRLAADGLGAVFLSWTSFDGSRCRGMCSRLESGLPAWGSGTGVELWNGFFVSGGGVPQAIAAYDDGSCVVAVDQVDVALHKLDGAGNRVWGATGVTVNGDGHDVDVAATTDGGAVVVYTDVREDWNGGSFYRFGFVRAQKVGADGLFRWGGSREGVEISPGLRGELPSLVSVGPHFLISFRSYTGYLNKASFAPDISAQQLDESGSRLWGTGLRLCDAPGNQLEPHASQDLVSGAFVCWADKRATSENRIYVGRVNDTVRSFLVSGTVLDDQGTPVSGVHLEAVHSGDAVASNLSQSGGQFVLGVPEFWSGEVVVRLRGYWNHASPDRQFVTPVTQDLSGMTFTVSHTKTQWTAEGLEIAAIGAGVSTPAAISGGDDGCFVAWEDMDENGHSVVVGQHLDAMGDIRWTTGGDRFAGSRFIDYAPLVAYGGSQQALFVWNRFAELGSGIWGQLLDGDMSMMWPDEGAMLAPGDQIGQKAVCVDDHGGFFICWNDVGEQRLYMQRFTEEGVKVWETPAVIFVGTPQTPPTLVPDGEGGVLAGFQNGGYLYVQRVNQSGNVLWNGGVHPVTARALAFITPGDFRFTGRGGSAYMVWSERSEIDSADEKLRMNWIYNGAAQLGPAGQPLSAESAVQLVDDVVYDEGGGIRLTYTVVYGATTKLVAQFAVPHVGGTISYPWGDAGKTIATGLIFPRNSRLVNDENGGMLVFWREQGGLYAQRLDWYGNFLWFDRMYRVFTGNIGSEADLAIASDGANGAYIAWRAPDGNLMATKHSDSLLVNADISISSVVRKLDQSILPMEGNHAVACPGGDEDNVVVRLDLEGEMMNFISAEAIQVVPPAGSPVLFQATMADSAPRWHGDRFRTTVTLSEVGGCGHDSAEVQIYGSPVGVARFSIRSPDLEIVQSPGEVNISDFATFGAHYPPYGVPPAFRSYSECADFTAPDGTPITAADFGFFGEHLYHTWQGGGALVAQTPAQSSGRVVLVFEQDSDQQGGRSLTVTVGLENIEPFQAAVISLKNVNPQLDFDGWQQDTSYAYATVCKELYRDGVRQVMIGVMGAKEMTAASAALGRVNLRVAADEELTLTDEDFELMVGDILTVDGRPMSVAPRRVDPVRHIGYGLWQNYPNPFNPITTIQYSLAEAGMVDLRVYDVRGALVKTLVNGPRKRDVYKIVWDGHNNIGNPVASGVYFYRLKAGNFVSTRKMVLLR